MEHLKAILFVAVLCYTISLVFLFLYWFYGVVDSFHMKIFYDILIINPLSYALGYSLTKKK